MKKAFDFKDKYNLEDLLHIMQLLRGEGGCPWDREQDHHSIRNNFIEETYEAVEAIDTENAVLLKEELGDVLLQIVFHAQMEQEKGVFDFEDVCDGICKKLIYRHPHIFADTVVSDAEQVLANWDKLKRKEKSQDTIESTLRAVSRALPGLTRSAKVQKRADRVGFAYPDVDGAMRDLESELLELRQALESGIEANIGEEIGDLLFSAVNVSRISGKDPEEMLGRSTEKFIARVAGVERLAKETGIDLSACSADVLNDLWKKVKKY